MQTVSLFFGIKITFNYNEHKPPHFDAEYDGYKVSIDIADGEVLDGYIPRKQLILIDGWYELYQDEIMQNWELIKDGKEPLEIQGLRK